MRSIDILTQDDYGNRKKRKIFLMEKLACTLRLEPGDINQINSMCSIFFYFLHVILNVIIQLFNSYLIK